MHLNVTAFALAFSKKLIVEELPNRCGTIPGGVWAGGGLVWKTCGMFARNEHATGCVTGMVVG